MKWNHVFPKCLGPEIAKMMQSISGHRNCQILQFQGPEIAERIIPYVTQISQC